MNNVHYWILVSICATRKLGQVPGQVLTFLRKNRDEWRCLVLEKTFTFKFIDPFFRLNSGQVPGQVFTRNGLKEVNYEKYKSVSFLYPIDYQQKKSYGIPPETLIIRGSQDHALVGPLENQPLMIRS